MAKKKPRSTSARKIPKVRIVRPEGRPFQLRYLCPIERKEIRISTGTRDESEAEQQKAELEAKLVLGLTTKADRAKSIGPQMEWSDFREQYRTLHLATVRDRTALHSESRLDLAERILKPRTLGEMADPNALQQLQAKLLAGEQSRRKKPRSPHTVKAYIGCILGSLSWAHVQGWLSSAPKIRKLKTSNLKVMKGRPITAEEFQKMLAATAEVVGQQAADSWKHVLRGLWESALRLEELMNVSWDKHGTIRPIWKKGQLPILEIPAAMQKNDTEECIPLLPGFEAVLLETTPDARQGWCFSPLSLQPKKGRKVRHQRPNAEWVGKIISRIGNAAKIIVQPADTRTGRPVKYASAHDLRRSCGDRLRNVGVPPLVICRVMRHSSWETTRKHYAPGDVQRDAEVLLSTFQMISTKQHSTGETP